MTATCFRFGQMLLSLGAALLIGLTFIGAATGPALMTSAHNSVIVA
jgi:hypothetical protein